MLDKQLEQLSVTLGQKLLAKGWYFTCAESCTGGLVAKTITDIAGSSAYFECGFVTYSNDAKQDMLGVSENTLFQHGAVSEPVAHEMALGALHKARADIAVSISGIAGPDGGTEEKPVGTVCFAILSQDGRSASYTRYFSGDRLSIREQAAMFVLQTVMSEFF